MQAANAELPLGSRSSHLFSAHLHGHAANAAAITASQTSAFATQHSRLLSSAYADVGVSASVDKAADYMRAPLHAGCAVEVSLLRPREQSPKATGQTTASSASATQNAASSASAAHSAVGSALQHQVQPANEACTAADESNSEEEGRSRPRRAPLAPGRSRFAPVVAGELMLALHACLRQALQSWCAASI